MVPTELVPTRLRLKPDADGRDFACLFSVGRELRKSSFSGASHLGCTWLDGNWTERLPVRFVWLAAARTAPENHATIDLRETPSRVETG